MNLRAFVLACTAAYVVDAISTTDGWCDVSGSVCVSFAASNNDVTVTLQSTFSGWVGLGLGTSMNDAKAYFIGWKSNGSLVISQRAATGDTFMPAVAKTQDATVTTTPSTVKTDTSANLIISFTLPMTYFSASGPTAFIFATGSTAPTDPSKVAYHDGPHSAFSYSVVTKFATATGSSKTSTTSMTPQSSNQTSSNAACDGSGSVCASFAVTSANTVLVTVQSSYAGWVGIGFGSSMSSASSFFIAWNDNQQNVVSQRAATHGEYMPVVSTAQDAVTSATPASFIAKASSTLIISFTLPISYFSSTGPTSLIYATCSTSPTDQNNIAYHDGPHGSLSYDISTGASTVAMGPPQFVINHGILMFLAWGVLPYATIFIARYLKGIGHAWFILHAIAGGIAICALTAAGVALMAVGIGFKVNGSVHVVLGSIVVYGLLPLQVLCGIASDRLFDPNREAVPWWDQVSRF
ncbi:hypothetical protein BC830DRAFT_1104166 [Chytriomyces sp. MP71]|nr:hypothetical protein BC830DRAFT_1104166 [Chytriomyces sp. MP71]